MSDLGMDLRATPEALLRRSAAERGNADMLEQRADTGISGIDQQRSGEFERRREERGADTQEFNRRSTDLQQATAKGPEKVAMPNPDLGPMLDPKQTQDFVWSIFAMSLVGAAAGRKHWNQSMAAFDGMLKGMKEGSEAVYDEKRKQFSRELTVAREKQNEAISTYEQILSSKKQSLNQIAEMMRIHAHANQDWDMEAAARERRFDAMYRKVAQYRTASDRLQTQATQLQDRLEARAEKAAAKKAAAESGEGILNEDTLRLKAEQYLEGDETVKRNLGRGTQGSKNIAALENMIGTVARERGMNAKQIVEKLAEFQGMRARERTLGGREANMQTAAFEAREFADLALSSAKDVWRSNFVPLNQLVEKVQEGTASPEQRRFVVANRSLITAYGQVMARTGARTVHDTHEAEKMLMTADGAASYQAGVDQIKREIEVALKAPGQARENLRGGGGGGGEGAPRKFKSESEAAGAGLKDGDKVIINGVSGTWRND